MAFWCPRCEPDRTASYGYSPALCPRHAAERDAEAPADPAPLATLADPQERRAAFDAAMEAGDAAAALAIARAPLPATWPENVRRPWAARRALARIAVYGSDEA